MTFPGRSRKLSYWIDSLLLVGLCVLFFWRDLTPVAVDRRDFTAGDFAFQFYASAHYAAERLHAGQLPLWNPYSNSGRPFLADMQDAIYYPPRLLNIALTSGQEFPYRALEFEALLHFPLIAISTYLLARRLTGSRAGGWVAAIAFTFSTYLTGYPILQLAILETQAWLPLMLLTLQLAGEALDQGDGRRATRWGVGAGMLLALSWLAGHPQAGMLVTYGAAAFAAFRLWPRPVAWAWHTWRPRLAVLAAFLITGFGLAAMQFIPSLELMRLSVRSGISFEEAGAGFSPYDLWQIALPAVGVPFTALYLGVIPVGLAATALIYVRRAGRHLPALGPQMIAFWGWSGLVALLVSFGKFMALYPVFYLLVPGWGLFRQQERTVVWVVLAAALLAAYGAAWITRRSAEWLEAAAERAAARVSRAYGLAALGAFLLTTIFFVGYQAGRDTLWGFTAACALLTLLLGLSALVVRSGQAALLVALLALDLFTLNSGNHSKRAQQPPFPPQPLLSVPQTDPGAFRMANEGILPRTYGEVYGLEEIGGATPLRLAQYQQLLDAVPAPRVWQLLGVAYVLSQRDAIEISAERIATQDDGPGGKPAYLYRLAKPGPRAWLAGQVIEERDEARLWQRLAAPDFDPGSQVLLSHRPAGYQDAVSCGGTIAWQTREPEFLSLTVEIAQPCILVLGELDYPGWRARVDGHETTTLLADGALRSIVIPAGQHRVEMAFRPTSLYIGAAVTAVVLLLAVLVLLKLARSTRPATPYRDPLDCVEVERP